VAISDNRANGKTQDLAGRTAIISGAGKGLGRAYALELAARGARIVVNNRSHPTDTVRSADGVVDEIQARGGQAVADDTPVEDATCGQRLLERALDSFGRLDIVIANAGVSEAAAFHKQEIGDFRRVVDINLMGTVRLLHATFSHLYQQRRGAIVVSSSAAGLYGEHGLPAYSASKAAVIGLCQALALEGAAHGVRVNTIAPFATTAMTEASLPEALRNKLSPAAVAPVVAWLSGDHCPLNGEVLVAGGGRLARARTLMTGTCEDKELADGWKALGQPTRDYPSAVAMFQQFIGGL